MFKVHLTAIGLVLLITIVWLFYLTNPFADTEKGAILCFGKDSVVITEQFPGLPNLQTRQKEPTAELLGYLHGRDREDQLAALAIALDGKMAETYSNDYLWQDIWTKSINLPSLAEQVYSQLNDNERAILKSYSVGINAAFEADSKASSWQEETVLQSIIFWLIETVRQPKRDELLIQGVLDSRTESVLKELYPQSESLNRLFNRKKWDLLPWQQSLFYTEELLQADTIVQTDGDSFFSLYAPNRYPMSYYPLVFNRNILINLPGLPFLLTSGDSVSVKSLCRKNSYQSRLKFISKEIYDNAPKRLFNVNQQGKTPLEFSVAELENGFAVSQNNSGDSIPYFYFAKKELTACVKTLLKKSSEYNMSDLEHLEEFCLSFLNSNESLKAQNKVPNIILDSLIGLNQQFAALKSVIPVGSSSFRLKPAFYLAENAGEIIPTKDLVANYNRSIRRMNGQILPVITIKFSAQYPKLEFLLLNGAYENPTAVEYNYLFPYWQQALFLPANK